MHRQLPIAGAVAAIAALREHADVVVLTNLTDRHREMRTEQLANHGIDARVFTNQGPKGPALQAILDEYRPSRAVFIDDLAQHHGSAADDVPHVAPAAPVRRADARRRISPARTRRAMPTRGSTLGARAAVAARRADQGPALE